jgi:hypothetical protein
MTTQVFDIVLEKPEDYDSAYFHVPFDVQKVFGTKAQVKVCGTIDGVPFRSSIANMGSGHCMVVNKQMRAALGKGAGDKVSVVMERDTAERTVDVPAELQQKLTAKLQPVWDKLSYTQQKEYVESIASAKKPETRQSRLDKVLLHLEERLSKQNAPTT